jgi:hypothetical protein
MFEKPNEAPGSRAAWRMRVAAVAYAATLLWPRAAEAQTAQLAPQAAAEATARAAQVARTEGLRAFQAGQLELARARLLRAYELDFARETLRDLAIAELRSKRPLEALRHLRQFVEDPRTPAKDRADAQQYLDEAYGRTGHLTVDGPAGAEVLLDGTPKSMCPMKSDLDVEAEREVSVGVKLGGKSAFAKVTCPAGRKVSVHVEVRGDAIATNVEIGAPGAAGAGAGGEKHAKGTLQPPAASHAHEGWPMAKTATVIGLGAAGVLGLATSAILIPVAKSRADDAKSSASPLAERQAAGESNDSLRTVATVAFYGGAALGIGALLAAVLWPNAAQVERTAAVTMRPVVNHRFAGVAGTF